MEAEPAERRGRSRLQPVPGTERLDVVRPERATGQAARQPLLEPSRLPARGENRQAAAEPWRGAGRTARLVRDAPVVTLDPGAAEREAVAATPSMQDINRFQFRRSHSTEPGLPVTPAGQDKQAVRRSR